MDDELFLSGRAHVLLARPSCAVGDALAAHFSYGPQRMKKQAGSWHIPERYAALQRAFVGHSLGGWHRAEHDTHGHAEPFPLDGDIYQDGRLKEFVRLHEAFMRTRVDVGCEGTKMVSKVPPHLRYVCNATLTS